MATVGTHSAKVENLIVLVSFPARTYCHPEFRVHHSNQGFNLFGVNCFYVQHLSAECAATLIVDAVGKNKSLFATWGFNLSEKKK